MKKQIMAALLMLAGLAPVYESYALGMATYQTEVQDKVAVRPDDLPEAVKATLASDAYSSWQVTSAFLITREDNSQYFEINLKKGEESSTANLDKFGKKVD